MLWGSSDNLSMISDLFLKNVLLLCTNSKVNVALMTFCYCKISRFLEQKMQKQNFISCFISSTTMFTLWIFIIESDIIFFPLVATTVSIIALAFDCELMFPIILD